MHDFTANPNDRVRINCVRSDRYLLSCEENLSRIKLVINGLGDYILILGETDFVDLKLLARVVEAMRHSGFDVLAIGASNIGYSSSGDILKAPSLFTTNSAHLNSASNLFNAISNPSSIARSSYSSILNALGPLDWAAYIGSHIYRRDVLATILSYHYPEYVYSLVYQQLQFHSEHSVSYGILNVPVIQRDSHDYDNRLSRSEKGGNISWLVSHRTDRGLSPFFHVSHFCYLSQIPCARSFELVMFGYAEALASDTDRVFRSVTAPTLDRLLSEAAKLFKSISVIQPLGDQNCRPSYLTEARYIYRAIDRMLLSLVSGNYVGDQIFDRFLRSLVGTVYELRLSLLAYLESFGCPTHVPRALSAISMLRKALQLTSDGKPLLASISNQLHTS